jgi:hypothetical protein
LAFDESKGRLWVICVKCARWNLTPVEERWEAIEDCERRFRSTTRRKSTEHIGLARAGDGLDLIRIGRPLRPEFAAWRYGDQLGRRRIAAFARIGVGLIAIAAISPFQATIQIVGGAIERDRLMNLGDIALLATSRKVIGRVTTTAGEQILIRNRHVDSTELLPPTSSEPWGLRLVHGAPRRADRLASRFDPRKYETVVRGEPAVQIARDILPRLNRHGASSAEVKDSVDILEKYRDAAELFTHTAAVADKSRFGYPEAQGRFTNLRPELRLALEMASQEDFERRALEGELQLLEIAWREAEEIASIADNMFLPASILERLADLKQRLTAR